MSRSARPLLAVAVALAALAVSAVPVLAVDEPVLQGTVVDADGAPFAVDQARMTMTGPDGAGMHAAPLEVAPDGTFEVALMPWGTAQAPAQVTIAVTGVINESIPNAAGCTDQYAPVAELTVDVALESGGEPEPVTIAAQPQIVGTVCGATAAPVVTLPPTVVSPETPAPSAAPAAPVSDTGSTPWLPLVLVAAVAVAAVLGGWRILGSRARD